MLLKPSHVQPLNRSAAGQRSPQRLTSQIIKALRWFGRFSNFYGKYNGRSLLARQQWLNAQIAEAQITENSAKEKAARKSFLSPKGEGTF